MDSYETNIYCGDGLILLPDYRNAFADPLPQGIFIYLVDVDHSLAGMHDEDGCIYTSTEEICNAFGSEESVDVIVQHTNPNHFTVRLRGATNVDSSEESTNLDSDSTNPDYGAFMGDPSGSESGDVADDDDDSDPSDHSDPAEPPAAAPATAPAAALAELLLLSDSSTSDSDDYDSSSSDDSSMDTSDSYAGSVVTEL